MKFIHLLCPTFLLVLLAGCTSTEQPPTTDNPNAGRYQMNEDAAPKQPQSVAHIENAKPKYEPYSRGGNKDYSVFGQSYKVLKHTQGFRQIGYASWYGMKFHGHKTSNGEIYDMYSMTAAHKTLPLPSYVKVTNLDNGKTVIVRVNDRGPFHSGRIIDLSYAAAYKLDMLKTGTARVEIELIHTNPAKPVDVTPPLAIESATAKPIKSSSTTPAVRQKQTETQPTQPLTKQSKASTPEQSEVHYLIQVSVSKYLNSSRTLSKKLSQKLSVASYINTDEDKFRVFLGPFSHYSTTEKTLEKVKTLGYQGAFIKKSSIKQ